MVADGFALLELCVCVWEREQARGGSGGGLDSEAKLPMQRRAVEASNKLLHVIWMRPELPAQQSEDLFGFDCLCVAAFRSGGALSL